MYDSDWNPQQDLQAQDRCHRLGQTRPVHVFRLVSENTVEEKIVERAQQKLKLDAMVVQQGRLKEKDKVSKEEIMAAVRFGADAVFKSEESSITDDDIDTILERGAKKTKELSEKLTTKDKGDLLDFRMDGGISAQTFEGVDYSDKELRDHLRMLAASSMGKRERRPPPVAYNPIIHSKKSMVVNNRRIKLPKPLRLPQMEDHHFYNRERLLELGQLEFENYAALRENGQVPPREIMERERSLLPPEMAQEKRELMAEGFGDWSRSQYYHFIKACAKYGRDDISSISADMDMPEDAVAAYAEAFWEYGPTELKSEWERVVSNIDRGEKKLAKQKKLTSLLTKFVDTFEDPRDEMIFANKGTTHFALEQDRALLTAVNKHGYGNWDSVREELRTDSRLKFQHTVQGMTVQAIGKRCDYRMRQMEKELDAREKSLKSRRSVNVAAAFKAIDAIKEMDLWDMQARDSQLDGEDIPLMNRLSDEAQQVMEERLKDRNAAIARLREIEVQVHRALEVAEETRQAIYRGDQYVNYSNITLKASVSTATKDQGATQSAAQAVQEGVEVEGRMQKAILKVPPCLQCENCISANRKLCVKRLEVRNKLIQAETKKLKQEQVKGGEKKKTKKRKIETTNTNSPKKSPAAKNVAPPKAKKKLMMKNSDGQLKPRVTSQGNKRMAIPEELFPEFCRRISAEGTLERQKLINQFVDDNPTISARQVTLKFIEVTTRDRPECVPLTDKKIGRAFLFYLRPCFYKYLPENERPPNWQEYAAKDEILYQEEKANEAKEESILSKDDAVTPSRTTSLGTTPNSSPPNGEETEEEREDIDEQDMDED